MSAKASRARRVAAVRAARETAAANRWGGTPPDCAPPDDRCRRIYEAALAHCEAMHREMDSLVDACGGYRNGG